MSKVIKCSHLILSDTVEILKKKIADEELAVDQDYQQDIVEETEKIVRELLTKAEKKAAEILDQAIVEAQETIAQANQEVDLIQKQAFDQGFASGNEQALAQVEQEKAQLLAEAKNALEDAKNKQEQYLLQVREEIVELAIQITNKLIGKQLTLEPKTILDIVNNVLEEAQPPVQSMVVIQVPPDSEEVVRKGIQTKLINWPEENLKLEVNQQMKPDRCRVVTSKGEFELSIADALANIKELLLGADIYE